MEHEFEYDPRTDFKSWEPAARYVVKHHQAVDFHVSGQFSDAPSECKGKCVTLDAFTASMLCQVIDALTNENRIKFTSLNLLRAVDIGWSVTKKAST